MPAAARPGTLEEYLARREVLLATRSGGTADARSLADLTDDAVSALAEAASSRVPTGFALFALGGYGARRLLPHSDIDLLVVSRGTSREVEPLVRAVVYPLWDLGLAVGYQVRAPREHARALDADLEVLTSSLTARFLAGDERLADETLVAAFARIRKNARRHLTTILARERPGSPYLLEPDLKNGAGGQRDLDELVWRASIATGAPARDTWPLVATGQLTVEAASALYDAQDAITASRWALHAAAGRARNTLALDDADALTLDAARTQRALETVHHALTELRGAADGATAGGGALTLDDLAGLASAGEGALPALERAARLGRFDHAVPGFGELMTVRRPGLSHRYTVGAHTLRALAYVARPSAAEDLAGAGSEVRTALLVAALAHDLGKREPGPGHAARGATQAPAIARRLGADEDVGGLARVLVREHLLLADVATRADIDDEDVVLAAAARLGDHRLVAALRLLTEADMRATGPDVWTSWREALIGALTVRIEAALSSETDGAGIVSGAERTRAAARSAARACGASAALLAFIDGAPLRYLVRRNPHDVLRDARMAAAVRGPSGTVFTFGVRPGPADATWAVDLVARDRRALPVAVTGVLELSGLDVLAAELHAHANGVAVGSFVVAPATLAPVEHATWASVERLLGLALSGRLDLETRLAERRRHYAKPDASGHVSVTLGSGAGTAVRIEVRAPDRVGLLHDLVGVLATRRLEVRRAAITTSSDVALDVFDVTDPGGLLADAGARDRLVDELERAATALARPSG